MLHSFGKYWFNITETFKILTQFTIYYQKNHIYLNNINSDHIQKFFKNWTAVKVTVVTPVFQNSKFHLKFPSS